jgi:hypothetical protein
LEQIQSMPWSFSDNQSWSFCWSIPLICVKEVYQKQVPIITVSPRIWNIIMCI